MTSSRKRLALILGLFLSLSGTSAAQTADDQAQVIADILTVIESENAYAAQNCGYFSNVANLCHAGRFWCRGIGIPGYPASGPDFIDPRLSRHPVIDSGYLRFFYDAGPPLAPGVECDPQSSPDYFYSAQPENLGAGRPSFAGVPDGTIYVDASGTEIPWPVPDGTATLQWPELTHPSPGATLPAASVTYRWAENDVPVNMFRLRLGSTPGGSEFFDSGPLGSTTTHFTVPAVGTNGQAVYARLEYRFAERSRAFETIYRAHATPSTRDAPELVTPTPSSTLPASATMFEWTANNTPVSRWRLRVGSRPRAGDYYRSRRLGSSGSAWVDGLPTDGSLVFTRLYYLGPDGWSFTDYRHQAAWNVGSTTPSLLFPVPGSDLPSASAVFAWTESQTKVNRWWIYAGSERGRADYFNSGPRRDESVRVTGLPAAGSPVYIRLWYRAGRRRWQHRDFVFGSVDLASDATTGGRAARRRRPSRRMR